MRLNEDFLHYIWQYRLLTSIGLYCTDGSKLEIIDPGSPNTHAGPDFSEARLRIGGQMWIGNVEIHLSASDWLLHQHQDNRLYDTVILHVVYEDDAQISRTDGSNIPVLLVKDLLPQAMLERYRALLDARNFFPCANQISQAHPLTLRNVLDTAANERLHQKSADLDVLMTRNKYNWSETFHQLLIRNFGFKVNNVPFELLAAGLPATLLARHSNQPLQIEALLFGQAGFLEGNFTDIYPRQLQTEYAFLRKKYQLVPLDRSIWKFLRMHPQNFPVLRIAQLAGMLMGNSPAISDVLASTDLRSTIRLFAPPAVHPYWKNHSDFDKSSKVMKLNPGRKSIENLIINTVCVMMYHYGQYFFVPEFQQRAISFLKKIPAEHNSITEAYKKAGVIFNSAWDTQAVLQLYKYHCSLRKCLKCGIGRDLIASRDPI